MTNHDQSAEKAVGQQPVDTPDNGQKLLSAAAEGQWLKGYDKDLTQKLQQDGVLPPTDMFDPVKVKAHLQTDQQKHQSATEALDHVHKQNTAGRLAIDNSKAADQALSSDFHTVSSTLHDMVKKTHDGADPNAFKDTVTRADLQGLVHTGTPEAKAAAKRLLDNWEKNGDFTSASASPGSPAALRNGVDPFINDVTLTRGMHKHDLVRADQEKDLAKSLVHEQELQKALTTLEQTMQHEQLALSASDKFISAAKLLAGNGYYQAADRMLNLDGQRHTEAERKLMTKLLQQHVADQHGGKAPKVLTYKDISVTPQSVDKLFTRINEIASRQKNS